MIPLVVLANFFHWKINPNMEPNPAIRMTRKTNSSYKPAPIDRITCEIKSLPEGNIKKFCENNIKKYKTIPHKKPSNNIKIKFA